MSAREGTRCSSPGGARAGPGGLCVGLSTRWRRGSPHLTPRARVGRGQLVGTAGWQPGGSRASWGLYPAPPTPSLVTHCPLPHTVPCHLTPPSHPIPSLASCPPPRHAPQGTGGYPMAGAGGSPPGVLWGHGQCLVPSTVCPVLGGRRMLLPGLWPRGDAVTRGVPWPMGCPCPMGRLCPMGMPCPVRCCSLWGGHIPWGCHGP